MKATPLSYLCSFFSLLALDVDDKNASVTAICGELGRTISPEVFDRAVAEMRTAIARMNSMFPPPDSPDLNPIENGLCELKALLRRIGAGTIDAPWKAIGGICALYSD